MHNKIILKNGIRLITAPLKDSKTAAALALFGTGSKYEDKKNSGISHFLEHMMFKGTKKRPTTLAISKELDSVGASYNAYTGKERTGYWIKADAKHLDLALDVLSDMVLNSKFEEKEIEKEKGVVTEEINMYQDHPKAYVGKLFEKLLHGDQPAGRSTLGTKETVKSFRRKDFVDYYKSQYKAENCVIALAGNFEEKTAVSKIGKYFSKMAKGRAKGKEKTIEKQARPESLVYFKETDQTHLILGVRAFSVFDGRKYALSLLNLIFGGNMSSRLFINVREKKGLAYYIYSDADFDSDVGSFAASAGVDNQKIDLAISAILEEMRKIRKNGVTKEELKKAKDGVEGRMNIALETSSDFASFFGEQEVLENKITPPEEILKKIKAVSLADVSAVARDVLRPEKLNLALIGPHKNAARFEKLLKI